MNPKIEKLENGLAIECDPKSPVFVLVWHGQNIMGPATYEDVKSEARRIQESKLVKPDGLENLI